MIKNLTIKRFKNISEINLSLKGINVLIGSNNSGKSSILQAIQFATSVAQSTKQQSARWGKDDRCPSSLSSETLIYSPLKDIDALAPSGKLHTGIDKCIEIIFDDYNNNKSVITVRKGKNKNIATAIEGKKLGVQLQDIEHPYTMFVPGLAGIPAFEEYKPPSIVRKSAARGDSNSVFRNIILLLSEDHDSWLKFKEKFNSIFPDYDIQIKFDSNVDEHIDARVCRDEISLPIDSCGTGILQAIQILAYYYLYRPTTLILDEPDSHLHPNNQKKLARLLKDINNEHGCQIIISTHSRSMMEELKSDASILWVNKSELVEGVEEIERNILMELGALEKGDLLRNGDIDCILLTEDSNVELIKVLAESSGFDIDKLQIWSYEGCANKNVALVLNSFISEHAPSTKVVIHRDRDYMTDSEVSKYVDFFNGKGIFVFVTENNDVEHYYINSEHISHLYTEISIGEVDSLIEECIQEKKDEIIEKFINTIHNRKLQAFYSGGDKPKAGEIALECQRNFDADHHKYMHGKIILNCLRDKLGKRLRKHINIYQKSPYLHANKMVSFSKEIWP